MLIEDPLCAAAIGDRGGQAPPRKMGRGDVSIGQEMADSCTTCQAVAGTLVL